MCTELSSGDIRRTRRGRRTALYLEEGMRGEIERAQLVHKEISWETRKDYEIHVGAALEIEDPSGFSTH
jgi:hypothetical protein